MPALPDVLGLPDDRTPPASPPLPLVAVPLLALVLRPLMGFDGDGLASEGCAWAAESASDAAESVSGASASLEAARPDSARPDSGSARPGSESACAESLRARTAKPARSEALLAVRPAIHTRLHQTCLES